MGLVRKLLQNLDDPDELSDNVLDQVDYEAYIGNAVGICFWLWLINTVTLLSNPAWRYACCLRDSTLPCWRHWKTWPFPWQHAQRKRVRRADAEAVLLLVAEEEAGAGGRCCNGHAGGLKVDEDERDPAYVWLKGHDYTFWGWKGLDARHLADGWCGPWGMVILRVLEFITFIFTMAWQAAGPAELTSYEEGVTGIQPSWLTYLTNWTFLLFGVVSSLGLALAIVELCPGAYSVKLPEFKIHTPNYKKFGSGHFDDVPKVKKAEPQHDMHAFPHPPAPAPIPHLNPKSTANGGVRTATYPNPTAVAPDGSNGLNGSATNGHVLNPADDEHDEDYDMPPPQFQFMVPPPGAPMPPPPAPSPPASPTSQGSQGAPSSPRAAQLMHTRVAPEPPQVVQSEGTSEPGHHQIQVPVGEGAEFPQPPVQQLWRPWHVFYRRKDRAAPHANEEQPAQQPWRPWHLFFRCKDKAFPSAKEEEPYVPEPQPWYAVFTPWTDDDDMEPRRYNFFHKAYLLLYEMAFVSTILVTIFFWAALAGSNEVLAGWVLRHGAQAFAMLLDVLISRVPCVSFHIIVTYWYGTIYSIFLFIFQIKKWRYPLVGWDDRLSPLAYVVLYIVITILFFIMFAFALIRDQIMLAYTRYLKRKWGTLYVKKAN